MKEIRMDVMMSIFGELRFDVIGCYNSTLHLYRGSKDIKEIRAGTRNRTFSNYASTLSAAETEGIALLSAME